MIAGGPAAFRRLCVETNHAEDGRADGNQPPSGGCVLKHEDKGAAVFFDTSRLRAAVC